mgnify:CR=1 FL=1
MDIVFKIVCENTWHRQVELEEFEKCHICKSQALHNHLVEEENENDRQNI